MQKSFCVSLSVAMMSLGTLMAGEPAPAPAQPAPTVVPTAPVPQQPPARPATTAPPGPRPALAAPRSGTVPPVKLETPADIKDMTNPAYLTDLAQVHLNYNDTERAEPLLRKVLEQPGKDVAAERAKSRAVTLLAQLLERKEDFKGAAENYQAAITAATDPLEKARYMMSLANVLEHSKEFDKAAEMIEQAGAIANASDSQGAQWIKRDAARRSVDLLRRNPARAAAAIEAAEAAVAKNPRDDAALERLAEIYSTVKPEPAKAVQYLEQLLALRPTATDVMMRLSTMYQQTKQPEKALELSKKMMESAPKEQQSSYAYQVAMQMSHTGKKDEAIKFYEDAVGKEPAKERDAMLLSMLYEQAGKGEQAEKLLKTAASTTKRPEEKASLLLRAADSARRRKDYAGAEAQLRALWTENKDNKALRENVKSSLMQVYREQGKPTTDLQLAE